MIYLDTSVALAQLLAEDRRPPPDLWSEPVVSSRLLQYEVWTRIHAHGLTTSHAEPARVLLAGIAFLELAAPVLERALDPFPAPVRTLDALHLASLIFLRERDDTIRLATYDARQQVAARALDVPLYPLA